MGRISVLPSCKQGKEWKFSKPVIRIWDLKSTVRHQHCKLHFQYAGRPTDINEVFLPRCSKSGTQICLQISASVQCLNLVLVVKFPKQWASSRTFWVCKDHNALCIQSHLFRNMQQDLNCTLWLKSLSLALHAPTVWLTSDRFLLLPLSVQILLLLFLAFHPFVPASDVFSYHVASYVSFV